MCGKTSMIKEFSSLHNHSHFSMMDGISFPEEIVKAAKERGIKSVALTDHGSLHGLADFYLSGKKHGVRTIYGVEAYVIDDLEAWKAAYSAKDEEDEDATATKSYKSLGQKGHLVLLACNQEGLSNLFQLVYKSYRDGFYGKPRMDKAMLKAHSKGVVATSACIGGVIAKKIWQMNRGECTRDDVKKEAMDFDGIFGRGRFFLELQFNEMPEQGIVNDSLVALHRSTGIPLTVATDSHYVNPEDWEAQEILYMLRGDTTMATRGSEWTFDTKELYLKGPEQMWDAYKRFGGNVPEDVVLDAFGNTLLIDSLVEQYEPDTTQRLPTMKNIENPLKTMGELAIAELNRRGLDKDERYTKQLLHELKIIRDKGISSYFIIMREIVNEARKRMRVGPGRGSAGGSLVTYLLGITQIDPIRHDLLFERFINPDRVELPDIDVDFQDPDGAKDILREMFGKDNVACLSTFGTFQIKGLLKDLGRVYDVDVGEVNKVNREIDKELRVLYGGGEDKSTIVIKLEDVERVCPAYNDFVKKHPMVGKHIAKLYGRNRHVGRHASGVVIGDNLPAETAIFTSKGVVQTSFTDGIVNKNLSTMGLVKFDILGLATLSVIDHALKLISQRDSVPYEELSDQLLEHNMDLNDPKVLKTIFWEGHLDGIFQFSEKGIRRLARQVQPECFEDVSAICAIYRPGPLRSGMDKLFVENKRNKDKIKYDHPLLEEILKPTYGCMIYQEQLLNIGLKLGKMSMKDVNRLRKLFLKKDKSKTDDFLDKEKTELRTKLMAGCKENNFPEEKAAQLWDDFAKWGGYGFNAAHSKAYALVSYQTAWLATYYPLEFYSAVLTVSQAGSLQQHVNDIKKRKIEVLPVDINKSKMDHVIESVHFDDPNIGSGDVDAIRLSFKTVLGVGPAAIEKIVARQGFTDFPDFLDRSGVGKTAVLPLIMVGAFDPITQGHTMMEVEDKYGKYCANPKWKTKKARPEWDAAWSAQWKGVDGRLDYELHEKVFFENALMGFSVRGSPFEILDRGKKIETLFEGVTMSYSEFMESEEDVGMLPVVVKDLKERAQARGGMMCFIKFGTEAGDEFEAPCFSGIWKHINRIVRKGGVYVVTFNRKLDNPESLVVGRPGFAHSAHSSSGYFINIDEVQL